MNALTLAVAATSALLLSRQIALQALGKKPFAWPSKCYRNSLPSIQMSTAVDKGHINQLHGIHPPRLLCLLTHQAFAE